MTNCPNCGFQLDPNAIPASCPRCAKLLGGEAHAAPPSSPGPGAPPAFDSEARPDNTLFGVPSDSGTGEAQAADFAAPAIETPGDEVGFGGLDAPLPPASGGHTTSQAAAPQARALELEMSGHSLELDLGGPVNGNLDLPAPAPPRPPAPPRRPPPPPSFDLAPAAGPSDDLDLPAPVSNPTNMGPPPGPAPEFGGLDLPAPSSRRSGSDLAGLDLPAPASRRTGPGPKAPPPPPAHASIPSVADLDLPAPSSGRNRATADLDLPAPAAARISGTDLPAPIGLDLPGGPSVDLPRPAGGQEVQPSGLDVTPASALVAPADLDLEPAGTGVAPADMDMASRDAGMLAPRGPRSESVDPLDQRPGIAKPRGLQPRAVEGGGTSRKIVYGLAAVGLLAALGGGLYVAGVFDEEQPQTTATRGLGPKKGPKGGDEAGNPDSGAAAANVSERSGDVLALLDKDTPSAYVEAAAKAKEEGDVVGEAEAKLLMHLRYGPDLEGAQAAANAIGGLTSEEPFVTRVQALVDLANKRYDAAATKLAGKEARVQTYRAMALLGAEKFAEAKADADAASGSSSTMVLATSLALEAQLHIDPTAALPQLQSATNARPDHPGIAMLLVRAALAQGALKLARDTAMGMPSDESLPSGYRAAVLTLQGTVLTAQGDAAAAIASFDRALEVSPGNSAVLQAKVRAGIDGQLFQPALEAMKELSEKSAKDPAVAMLNLELQVASGKGDDALATIEALSATMADRVELPFYRGEVQAMRLQVDEAQAEYAVVIEKDPTFHRVALAQAAMLVAARQPVEAVAALDAGVARLRKAEGEHGAAIAELLTAKARVQLDQQQTKAALTALDQALDASPTDNAAAVLRGTTRIEQGDVEGGQADLVAVYERAGGFPGLVAPLGKIFAANGELEKLEELVGQRADAPTASDDVKLIAARLRLAQGKAEEAKKLADAVLSRSANSWEAQLVMAAAFLEAGDHQEALSRVKTVRPPEPSAELAVLKGKILEYNGQPDEARGEYRKALTIDEGNLEARFLHGRLLAYRGGQAEAAIADLEIVVAATDAFPRAYLNIGRAQRDLGKNDEALAAFAKAIELDASLLEAHFITGQIQLDRNQAGKAIKSLSTAVGDAAKDERWYSKAYLALARAQERQGQKKAAKKSYEKFLEIAPENDPSRPAVKKSIAKL